MFQSTPVLSTLLSVLFAASVANGDMKDLIRENENKTAVMSALSSQQGFQGDQEYGLLLLSPQEFAAETELRDPSRLENAYFRVVENEGNEPVQTPNFDGDNVMYNLMKARRYYAKLAQASGVADPAIEHPVIVRLHVDEAYNPVLHFSQWNDYNNSRYIPAETPAIAEINQIAHPKLSPWSQEIWFDRRKGQLQNMNWYDMTISSSMTAITGSYYPLLLIVPSELWEHFNPGLDAAKMPDVIFHEAFHYATDTDSLFPMASEGNPVAEDYANYFGSSINGRPEIGEISEFSSRKYKRKFDKLKPIKNTNPSSYNATSFVPSLFWEVRKMLGQERADQLIWNSLLELHGSTHHTDLPPAVMKTVEKDSQLSDSERAQVAKLFKDNQKSFQNLELKFHPPVPESESQRQVDYLDEQLTRKIGYARARQIMNLSDELKKEGISLSDEESARITKIGQYLADETSRPGFLGKVRSSLLKTGYDLRRLGVDASKGLGIAGTAVFDAAQVPVSFASDFATGLVFGHGMLSEGDQNFLHEMTGAAGGVAAAYYVNVGLTLLGSSIAAPVGGASLGVVIVDSVLCAEAHTKPSSPELESYCADISKLNELLTADPANAGAKLGEAIRRVVHHPKAI